MSRGVNPLRDAYAVVRLVRIFRQERPTIVHTFDTKPGVWARLAAKIAGVPIIIGTLPGLGSLYASSSAAAKVIRYVYEPLQALASRSADLTVFQNARDAEDFVERGIVSPDRVTVIAGSGVRTDVFTPAASGDTTSASRADLGLAGDALVVTMISRVTRTKGVLDFAAAAQKIRALRPEIEFVLAGAADGEGFDALNERELGELDGSVRWIGFRDDVREILAFTDVFVFPSYYREGIPRVLMEAASMGLPLIAVDAPGSTDVVEDGRNGILVPPRNVDAIVAAVLRLADDSLLQKPTRPTIASTGRVAPRPRPRRPTDAVVLPGAAAGRRPDVVVANGLTSPSDAPGGHAVRPRRPELEGAGSQLARPSALLRWSRAATSRIATRARRTWHATRAPSSPRSDGFDEWRPSGHRISSFIGKRHR